MGGGLQGGLHLGHAGEFGWRGGGVGGDGLVEMAWWSQSRLAGRTQSVSGAFWNEDGRGESLE